MAVSQVSGDAEVWGTEVGETTVLGHPCLSYSHRRKHLAELLVDGRRFADREYCIEGDRRLTFAGHEEAVTRAAAGLRALGVRRGERVLLFGRNSIDWVIAFWAVLQSGAVVVLGNAWWGSSELAHALKTGQPGLVVTDASRMDLVPDTFRRVAFASLADATAPGPDDPDGAVGADEDDPAIILFTSGTTGLAKGAVLSHRGVLATLHSLAERTHRLPRPDGDLPPESKALLSLPLFHIGGLQQVLNPMVAGGTLVFTQGRFDPAKVVDLIESEQIRVWSTVPTMASRVIDYLESAGLPPLESPRTIGLGAAPVVEQLRQKVLTWFPNAARGFAVTWGLSEAGGVVTTGAGPEIVKRPGTVGTALSTAMLRIDSPDANGVGEIWVRSPSVMLRYWRPGGEQPEEGVDEVLTPDRWLRTGDIGWMDEQGYLFITDRSKDIVIRGGENIATPHVENRLLEHPAVREVAVVGLPHPSLGEELGAIVTLNPTVGDLSSEELAAFVGAKLAYFEVPTRWWFHGGSLPHNSTGKVLKRQLRQTWLDRREGQGQDGTS
jgi:long-chain acyl-CoA synthetase